MTLSVSCYDARWKVRRQPVSNVWCSNRSCGLARLRPIHSSRYSSVLQVPVAQAVRRSARLRRPSSAEVGNMVIQNIIRAGNGGGGFDDDSSSSSSDSSSSSSSSLNPYENMNPILRIREDANPYQDGPYDDFGECPRVKCSRCKCWRKLRGFLCPEEDEDGNVVARPLEYSREFILMCQAGDRPITCEMLHREDECGENPDDMGRFLIFFDILDFFNLISFFIRVDLNH